MKYWNLPGIVISTFLNMIVIPALYMKYGRPAVIDVERELGRQGEMASTGD